MKLTAREVAEQVGAILEGDGDLVLVGVAAPERAGSKHLIYVETAKHIERAVESKALCVVAGPGVSLAGKSVLRTVQPKVAFAKATGFCSTKRQLQTGDATAMVASRARLGADAGVGAYAVVGENVHIGDGTQVGPHCVIGADCWIGERCRIHPRVTLYPGVRIGNGVEIHAGAVIGADGFGYAFDGERYWKFPQPGIVEIADEVEIGANTTIDRGSLDDTRIAEGVKIDNLVHVGHNVQIGAHSVIAAQTGISGSANRGITWCAAGKSVLRTIARWRISRSQERRRAFPPGRPFTAGKPSGARRRGRWISLRKRMGGLRDCRNWARGLRNWKRNAQRRANGAIAGFTEIWEKNDRSCGKRKKIVAIDCGGRAHSEHREDALGV